MPDKFTKEAKKLLPKKKYCAYNKKWQSTYPKDCQNIGYAKSIADCTPIVADLLEKIDELKAGSTEVGVEEIYEELKNWGGNIQSSQSLTSEEMDEFLKDIAQSINNLKEKE